jgi:hypothetical protein
MEKKKNKNSVAIEEDTFKSNHKKLIPLIIEAADRIDVYDVIVKESDYATRDITGDAAIKFGKLPNSGSMVISKIAITKETIQDLDKELVILNFVSALQELRDKYYKTNGETLEFDNKKYSIVTGQYLASAKCEKCDTQVRFSRERLYTSETMKGYVESASPLYEERRYETFSKSGIKLISSALLQEKCDCKNFNNISNTRRIQ